MSELDLIASVSRLLNGRSMEDVRRTAMVILGASIEMEVKETGMDASILISEVTEFLTKNMRPQ